MSTSHEANPDSRPLPDGWITEYSPQWNAWYYVNTKDANPQAIWNHPADNAGAAPGISSGAAPPSAATPSNPDSRPLPEGWISEYSPEHKTFYYVNTKAADPGSTVTWSHPVDAKDGAATGTGTGGGHSATPVPASGAGGKHNPDTRPLPTGWITDYDENYKAWYYVDTNHPEKGSSWQHPSETQGPGPGPSSAAPVTGSIPPLAHGQQHSPVPAAPGPSTTSPGPISQGASYTGPPASENPDKRPLPPGWTAKFDENYKTWYYVDTTKPNGPSSWEHPADKTAALGATPSAGGAQKPALNITTPGSTSPSVGGGHASNPDTRPLPAGWITQYDSNRNTWFYVNTTVHPPQTTWEHPAGKLAASPGSPPPIGQQGAAGTTPGKGLEGLLGAKGGKMVGGLLGSKARTQMDGFADLLGTEYSKFKKTPGGAPPGQAYPGQSQYQAPPGQVPGQAVPPPANPPPPAGGLGGSLGNLSGMAGKFGFGKK